MEPHKDLGTRGEDFAVGYLKWKKGFKVLERNFHAVGGEIDIIAWDPREKIHILVEVKTRKNEYFADGIDAITPHKLHKMQLAAMRYFLWKCQMRDVPDFEIHGMVLLPGEKGFLKPEFEVEYYDEL